MTEINRQWLLRTRPQGMMKEACFAYRETPVPRPGEGEILVRILYLSFDPAMRTWMDDRPSYIPPVAIGEPMRAGGVGQVVASQSPAFEVGDFVQGLFSWQDYVTVRPDGGLPVAKVPPSVPLTLPLGVLGITGFTAYFGLLDIGRPQSGQTVVVSGAAGATGSVAGQIARIKGCRVIGIAGGEEKCAWLRAEAGFDDAIDYKSESVSQRLAALCPDGIDVFFDNVGGAVLDAALARLGQGARVVICGGISRYNDAEPTPGPSNYLNLIVKRARMEGFVIFDYLPRFGEAFADLWEWVSAGKLAYREDVEEGLEHAPRTLLRLFAGKNLGKQLLRVADPPLAVDR